MVFQAPKLRIIYLLISIFLLLINPCATQIFFNYTDFNNKPIIRTGNASILGSVIQLTPDEVDNWGRATYSEQMHLWDEKSEKVANFTSNFSFIINSQGKDSYSDGITFFLSTPNYPIPSPTDGSGLGLLSRNQMRDSTFLAANKFVAVEFDTFRNTEYDSLNSVREHVGININNMKSQISTPWNCTIKENRTYSASINYDSNHLPELVDFGFSASTGLISELHILSTWSFESTAPSTIQQSPAPSVEKNKDEPKTKLVVGLSLGVCILIIGLVLVYFVYRKKCREGKGEKEEELGFNLSMDDEFEQACGRKPAEPYAKQDEIIMLEWVWELYGARNLLKAADPRLGGDFDEPQMERLMVVGLWCAHPDYNARPSIRKAIHVLDFEVTLPILTPPIIVSTSPTRISGNHDTSTSSTSKSGNHDA
ncbi:hypothetical protein CMV_024803 [Castanea mollissima]|uniref:Legume lectin domain-containing protein n=1 Tax=Castanea mollissima TaxID=60419 RepID=A0A8J4VHL4_9ROSI|nr:hypothetical protein CMV_024803 [Castanea mollissima]